MPSVLAWVDYSSSHREDMDRLLDAFRDKGTVDELGVGTVRDVFSELLFPGTSTLHTRARYLLFVPWAVLSVTGRALPVDRALRELRQLEVRLIEALRAGDIDGGVIGRDARDKIGRTASVAYWGALSTYDIKRCSHTIAQHCRYASERPMASVAEDDETQHLRHVAIRVHNLELSSSGGSLVDTVDQAGRMGIRRVTVASSSRRTTSLLAPYSRGP